MVMLVRSDSQGEVAAVKGVDTKPYKTLTPQWSTVTTYRRYTR